MSEAVQSNSTAIQSLSSLDDLGQFFELRLGNQTLAYGSGDDQFSLSISDPTTIKFTVNNESDYLNDVDELVQIIILQVQILIILKIWMATWLHLLNIR